MLIFDRNLPHHRLASGLFGSLHHKDVMFADIEKTGRIREGCLAV